MDYIFINTCADKLLLFLVDSRSKPEVDDEELTRKKEVFISDCYAEYQKQNLCEFDYEINYDEFKELLMELFREKIAELYAFSA